MAEKKVIAVIFGGRSVEHDVSILTGLQFLEALDPTLYEGLPVYVDPLGQWWTGDRLRGRGNYPLAGENGDAETLTQLHLDLATGASGRPRLVADRKTLIGLKREPIEFDLMVPAIHGPNGEDGTLQGLLDFAGIPYAGCRILGAAATMDKAFTKNAAAALGLPVLSGLTLKRPAGGGFLDQTTLETALSDRFGTVAFPFVVKPRHLGSSVGVGKADTMDDLIAAVMTAFRFDAEVLVEPCVTPLVEYNIAVRRTHGGTYVASAIERPKSEAELLDFSNKYRAGGTGGAKQAGGSEGMASLNRTLNPGELGEERSELIRASATRIAEHFSLAGSVRVDFLCNGATGEIWLNEVNTIPGSFAYFLWEAAEEPLSFLNLTRHMIEEGFALSAARLGNTDAAAGGATLFGG